MLTETQGTAQVTPNAAPVGNQATPQATPATVTPPAPVVTEVTPPAAAAKPLVPERYDLKAPEGSLIKPGHIEAISAYAKQEGLTNEQAQKVLDREHAVVEGYYKSQLTEFEQAKESWKQEILKDPEIGGEGFQKNIELAHRALEKYGTPKFIAELDATGYGNHPELVRIFARIGKLMADDKMVSPGAQTGGQRTYEDVFYGPQKT